MGQHAAGQSCYVSLGQHLVKPALVSPPGIAMPLAGLCFTDVTIVFNVAPVVRQRVD